MSQWHVARVWVASEIELENSPSLVYAKYDSPLQYFLTEMIKLQNRKAADSLVSKRMK